MSVTQWRSYSIPCNVGLLLSYETESVAPLNGLQKCCNQQTMLSMKPGTPGPTCFLALGSFTCVKTHTHTHMTSGFTSYPKDEALWLSVLVKDTCVKPLEPTRCWSESPAFISGVFNRQGNATMLDLLLCYYFVIITHPSNI